jgi:uncharacterized protein
MAAGAATFGLARLTLRAKSSLALWGWVAVAAIAHAAWRAAPSYDVRQSGQTVATALLVVTLSAAIGFAPALVARLARGALRLARGGARLLTRRPRRARRADAPPPPAPPAKRSPAPEADAPARVVVSRRSFVSGALATAPVITGGAGVLGITEANAPPLEPLRAIELPQLSAAFEGARILQISDVHLGFERSVADVERFVASVLRRGERPDLVVLTGDIADDLAQLDPALAALLALEPRWGTFACLGNHEYFHDVSYVRDAYARRGIPLLVDEGARVKVAGGSLWLGGVDDPIVSHGRFGIPSGVTEPFYRARVERAIRGASADDFKVLLSHRPEGFVLAARAGVDLTLSGHTHGGHVGFTDKSLIERLAPELPMWGSYGQARSRLYVTSGFGHWFRFRLGCPTEAPWVELRRGRVDGGPAAASPRHA